MINEERLLKVLLAPNISEKATTATLKTTVLFASAAVVAFSEIFGAKSTFNKRSSFIMLKSPQFL
jgi:hypothetical protein